MMPWHMRRYLLSTAVRWAPIDGPGDDADDGVENAPPPGDGGEPPQMAQGENPLPDPHAPPAQETGERAKPEWLDNDFWDAEKGEIRTESLHKAFKDTKAKVGEREEQMRERIAAELKAENAPEDLPESPEGYTLDEGLTDLISTDDPLLQAFQNAAHAEGIAPKTFNAIVKGVLESNPAPDPEAEKAKLGDQADARIERVSNYVNRHLKDEQLAAVQAMTTTADGVMALETLLRVRNDTDRVGSEGAPAATALSDAAIKQKMADPRYQPGPQQDMAFVAEVQADWQRFHSARRTP